MLDGLRFSHQQPKSSKTPTPGDESAALQQLSSTPRSPRSLPRSSRVISEDDASLSQRVRSMYDCGAEEHTLTDQTLVEVEEESDGEQSELKVNRKKPRPISNATSRGESVIHKELYETAGGIEDWEDINGDEVDRYGFIISRKTTSRGSNASPGSRGSVNLHRVSTALLDASNTPRRKNLLRRIPSRASSRRPGSADGTPSRTPSRRSLRPQGSVYSNRNSRSFINSQTSFKMPLDRKDRKLFTDAEDMLTLPPGLAELEDKNESTTKAMKEKEWQRQRKWKKMAKLKPESTKGGTMIFDFDTTDAKVISRTWKGIPDCWRASAWYSFLETSAKKKADSPREDDLTATYYALQQENSADDVQIDCDVPRTISRHIMFRRRYRGGQRLLFRVLHALSLYFPEVGYVQGMAALAATLLCYYDEEGAFVMMVRLWQLRGLQRLYESGFEGLMDALNEFEKEWLCDGDVAKKLVRTSTSYPSSKNCLSPENPRLLSIPYASKPQLTVPQQDELGIHLTAYGTRWYLTLFNYSIPFPAQLRVWDVFMLLGDESHACTTTSATTTAAAGNRFHADLDVLHATSAALVDATRHILLDSDFENAMKVLTSWIPIKDEDLLMKVANAEWKRRKRRAVVAAAAAPAAAAAAAAAVK
jgi:Rab-GTPase-TBC domain